MNVHLEWGEWIEDLIRSEYPTQKEAGEAIGVAQNTVGRWFGGGRPNKNHARKTADHFGIPRSEFFERAGLKMDAIDRRHDEELQESEEPELSYGANGQTPLDEWNRIVSRLTVVQQRAIIEMLRTFVEP